MYIELIEGLIRRGYIQQSQGRSLRNEGSLEGRYFGKGKGRGKGDTFDQSWDLNFALLSKVRN